MSGRAAATSAGEALGGASVERAMARLRPLPRRFFERPVVELAAALVGQLVVRRDRHGVRVARIVETEAYGGRDTDPSAHSFRGPTDRCAVMFGPAGFAYVYATQGRCSCLNVVAQGDRDGKAVLIRAAEPVSGVERMRRRRLARLGAGPTRVRLQRSHDELLAGPGRLCVGLDVDRGLNAVDMTAAGSPLHLAAGPAAEPVAVRWTPRIGLNPDSDSFGWRWRAIDPDSRSVSAGKGVSTRRYMSPRPAVCPVPTTDS